MADPEPGPAPPAGEGGADELLGRLQGHLRRAAQAAEGLRPQPGPDRSPPPGSDPGSQPGSEPGPDRRPPPGGWTQPGADGASRSDGSLRDEIELALGLLASLRDRIPPELQQRLTEAVREVLLALRAVIDWYLARTVAQDGTRAPGADARAQPGARASGVRDIPIL